MKYETNITKEISIHNNPEKIDDIEIIKSIDGDTIIYKKKTKTVKKGKYEVIIDKRNKYIYIKDTNNKISIYDIEKRKMIIKDWIIDKKISFDTKNKSDIMFILKNPKENGMHIFNPYAIRQGDDIFNKSFKNITFIRNYPNYLFIVTQEKQGVYSYNENNKKKIKLEEPIEYDKIDAYEHLIIFTKGKQQIAKQTNDLNKKTDYYETIEIENKEPHKGRYIKCRKNKTIDIIHIGRLKKIISSDKYDDINIDHIKERRNDVFDFFFNVEKDNQQGIVKTRNIFYQNESTPQKIEEIVEVVYDKVYFNGDDYITIKNNKYGLSIGDTLNDEPIEPEYDLITQRGIYSYLFKKDNLYTFKSIISRGNYPKIATLVENCKIINYDESNNSYIIEKDAQLGIFFSSIQYCIGDSIIPAKYDDIIKYKNNFYFLVKDNKITLCENDKIIIKKEYEDIKIGIEEKCYDYNRKDKIYFALKENGKYKLAKRNQKDQPIEIIETNEYKEVEFIENLIICKDNYCTYIYNYEDKLVAKFPPKAKIECIKDSSKISTIETVLKINNRYYYYKDGNLYIPYIERLKKYTIDAKPNNNSYNITTYNKDDYEKLIEFIGDNNENKVEEYLESIISQGTKNSIPSVKIKKLYNKE